MKRAMTLGLLALAGASFTARAADLGAPSIASAPVLAPTPVSSWAGFYAGIGLGGRWTQTEWTTNCLTPTAAGACPGTALFATRVINDNPATFDLSSAKVSGYVGYNWQLANWVLGVEGDVAWADSTRTFDGIPGTHLGFAFSPFGGDVSSVRDRWDASVRARVGYVYGPAMVYMTGGVAWMSTEASASCLAGSFAAGGWCTLGHAETVSKTLLGWTGGVGFEWMFVPNWIFRGEYRYADYTHDSLNNRFFVAGGVDTFDAAIDQRTHTLSVGLSYLFNWSSPVVGRY